MRRPTAADQEVARLSARIQVVARASARRAQCACFFAMLSAAPRFCFSSSPYNSPPVLSTARARTGGPPSTPAVRTPAVKLWSGGEGQQRDLARALDRDGQAALMARAGAGLAPRLDLAALGDVAPQLVRLLVVDVLDLVDAESADLAAARRRGRRHHRHRRNGGRSATLGPPEGRLERTWRPPAAAPRGPRGRRGFGRRRRSLLRFRLHLSSNGLLLVHRRSSACLLKRQVVGVDVSCGARCGAASS